MPNLASSNMASLPAGFVGLLTARQSTVGTPVNLIGVVMDIMEPSLTRKSSYMFTFKLNDRSLSNAPDGGEGLKVRFFSPDPNSLPKVRDIGDVVLIRSVTVQSVYGEVVAISNYQSGVLVFPSAAIPNPSFSIAYQDKKRIECLGVPLQVSKLNLAEQSYVMHLKADMAMALEDSRHRHRALQRRAEFVDASAEPPAKKQRVGNSISQKFKLVKELQDRAYADVLGLVVKRIAAAYGCDLYLTDYTSNDMVRPYPAPEEGTDMGRDGDSFGYVQSSSKPWPGPFGHTILKVNIKPPHADFAIKSVQEGDLVLLRNVKARITTWGDHGMFLEGDMWPDHQNDQQVNIRKNVDKDSAEVRDLLERKERYWKEREEKLGQRAPRLTKRQKKAEKAANKVAVRAVDQEAMSATKKSKKAGKRARKLEALQQRPQELDNETPDQIGKTWEKNRHIRCSYAEVPLSSIKSILDPGNDRHSYEGPKGLSYNLPFVNARYRAKVRVVDFEPKLLEDFVVPVLANDDDKSVDSMAWQYDGTPKHEWYFSLLLEDGSKHRPGDSDRVWVQVHHEQAQFLLGNGVEDPEDLSHNRRLLAKLKEKLFVLWGNLEEKSEKQELSNLPFECCIMEYGVERDGDEAERLTEPCQRWQRMYAMFGATIL